MPGETGRWLRSYCGPRNCGWLGSFQIDQRVTSGEKRRETAIMNLRNSSGLGRVTWSRAPLVAQRGTGPDAVTCTFQPRRCASSSTGWYLDQSYTDGSLMSTLGLTRDVASGATSLQYRTIRSERAPRLSISLKAASRLAGSK